MLFAFLLRGVVAPAQAADTSHTKAPVGHVAAKLPPFSGTWVLNQQRSKLLSPVNGESKAVIDYDGKKWHYIHTHLESPTDLPDSWQMTLVVDSPKYATVLSDDIVFQSRIVRQGNTLLLQELGKTLNGQKFRNTVHYTLENDGNTLLETETLTSPLGPERNLYVLDREPVSAEKQVSEFAFCAVAEVYVEQLPDRRC